MHLPLRMTNFAAWVTDEISPKKFFKLCLRLPYFFRGASRPSDVARPVQTVDNYITISN